MPEVVTTLTIMLLLIAANGSPVLGKRLLGSRLAVPLDGGLKFFDGRPLLGPSKTVRGVVLSLIVTAAAAALLGLPWLLGLGFAAASMAGDAISSFLKRRFSVPSSDQALGIDQIPEALLPMWLYREAFALTGWEIGLLVLVFILGELLISQLMFRLGVRDRPY
jgi:hypothetical protein